MAISRIVLFGLAGPFLLSCKSAAYLHQQPGCKKYQTCRQLTAHRREHRSGESDTRDMGSHLAYHVVVCDRVYILIRVSIALCDYGTRRWVVQDHPVSDRRSALDSAEEYYHIACAKGRRIDLLGIYYAAYRYTGLHAAADDYISVIAGKLRDHQTETCHKNGHHNNGAYGVQQTA